MFEVCVRKALAGQKSGLKMHLPIITSFCEILDSVAFFFIMICFLCGTLSGCQNVQNCMQEGYRN